MYNVTSWLAELFFSLVFCKFHNFEFKKKWILHSHMFANLRQFVLLYGFDAKSQKVHFLINFLASKPTIALISPDCKKIHFQWDFLPEAVKSISNCSISVQSPFLNKKVELAPGRTGPCPNFSPITQLCKLVYQILSKWSHKITFGNELFCELKFGKWGQKFDYFGLKVSTLITCDWILVSAR